MKIYVAKKQIFIADFTNLREFKAFDIRNKRSYDRVWKQLKKAHYFLTLRIRGV